MANDPNLTVLVNYLETALTQLRGVEIRLDAAIRTARRQLPQDPDAAVPAPEVLK